MNDKFYYITKLMSNWSPKCCVILCIVCIWGLGFSSWAMG